MEREKRNASVLRLIPLLALGLAAGCSVGRNPETQTTAPEPSIRSMLQESEPKPVSASENLTRALRDPNVKLILLSFCVDSMNVTKEDADKKKTLFDSIGNMSFGKAVTAICADMKDDRNKTLGRQVGVNPDISYPVTVAVATPGKLLGMIRGYPSQREVTTLLSACSSSDCGPTG